MTDTGWSWTDWTDKDFEGPGPMADVAFRTWDDQAFLAAPGDMNQDGLADLVIELGDTLWLHHGSATADGEIERSTDAIGSLTVRDVITNLAGGHDWTGDGVPDVAVAAYRSDFDYDPGTPTIHLIAGPWNSHVDESDPHVKVLARASSWRLEVQAGEVDGLAGTDLIVGETRPDHSYYYTPAPCSPECDPGRVYLLTQAILETGSLETDAPVVIQAANQHPSFGRSFAVFGDGDGDGIDDIVVGGMDTRSFGPRVSLFRGGMLGSLVTTDDADATLRYTLQATVAAAGDLDGDGHADFLSSEQLLGNNRPVEVYSGRLSGTFDSALAMSRLTDLWDAEDDLTTIGDFDGDGQDDLMMRGILPYERHSFVGIYLGPIHGVRSLHDWDLRWVAREGDGTLGNGMVGPGDTNGDGFDDAFLSSYREDNAYLVIGGVVP